MAGRRSDAWGASHWRREKWWLEIYEHSNLFDVPSAVSYLVMLVRDALYSGQIPRHGVFLASSSASSSTSSVSSTSSPAPPSPPSSPILNIAMA